MRGRATAPDSRHAGPRFDLRPRPGPWWGFAFPRAEFPNLGSAEPKGSAGHFLGFRGEIQRVPAGFQEPHSYSLPSKIGSATREIVSARTCHLTTRPPRLVLVALSPPQRICAVACVTKMERWLETGSCSNTSGALKCHLKTQMIARLNQKFDEGNSPRMIRKNDPKIRDTTPSTSHGVPRGFRDVQEGFREGFRGVGAHAEGFR